MGKTAIANGGPNDKGVLQGLYLFPAIIGNVFFVSSVSGSSSGPGVVPENAYATLAQAVTAATADNGDTIIVLPGHLEDIAAAAAITISKSGLRIIGMGTGHQRPTFTWKTSTAAQIIISGAYTRIENCVFDFTGIDAVVAAISVIAADVSFSNCEFVVNSATAGCVLGILTAATATRFTVEGCRFLGAATNAGTTVTACITHAVGVDYVIRDNYFTGKMTQAILNATNILRGVIDSNRFVIATGTAAITMASGSTPFIVNNRINVPSGTTPITAAAGFVSGNSYSAAAGVTAGTASTI